MTDTISCSTCAATLPAGAAFCTSCGSPIGAPATAADAPPGPPDDATLVDMPGLHDSTQVFAAPPAPPAPPSQDAPPAGAPWQPADATPPPPPAPPAPPGPPSWTPPPPGPVAPQPPAWQQPPPAPPTQWGEAPAAPPWGAQPAASGASEAGRTQRSPLGAAAAVVGGLLTLVGLFTTWFASNTGLETTGWNLAGGWTLDSGVALESSDPYALLALGVLALLVGAALFVGKARVLFRIAALAIGASIIAVLVRDWTTVVDTVQERMPSAFELEQKAGYLVGIGGGVVTMVAALLPAKKTDRA